MTLRIGPPLQHTNAVLAVAISPDGRTVLTASEKTVRLWEMPVPMAGDARRIGLWVQSVTGMELDGEGVIQALDDDAWEACRRELVERGGPPIEQLK